MSSATSRSSSTTRTRPRVRVGDAVFIAQKWPNSLRDFEVKWARHDDPLVAWLEEHGEPFLTLEDNPTAENIARAIYDHVRVAGYPVKSVRLWETPTSHATYSG